MVDLECVWITALNTHTVKNSYAIPRIDELFDRAHTGTVFSSLDLSSGYHQISIQNDDIYKTAFNTRYGHYEYLVVLFGLCNTPATFQHMIHSIFLFTSSSSSTLTSSSSS